MSLKKSRHVLVADKFAAARLLASLLDRGACLGVKFNGLPAPGRDGHQQFGGLILFGLGQLSHFLYGIFKQLAHGDNYTRRAPARHRI